MTLIRLQTAVKPKKMEWHATVVRCNCLQAGFHEGLPCPEGVVEDLGRVDYWHRNPLIRFWVLTLLPILDWAWGTATAGAKWSYGGVRATGRMGQRGAGAVVAFARNRWRAIGRKVIYVAGRLDRLGRRMAK